MASRDIYGRRPTSKSRGKTVQQIMDLQHADGVIPGAEQVLADRPDGSIAAAMHAFHVSWVEPRPVTTRRGYERSLAFFARDLAERGPQPSATMSSLDQDRLVAHLQWRLDKNLHDAGELQRSMLHLARLLEWSGEQFGLELTVDRDALRAAAVQCIDAATPPFHASRDAAELRDVSADADTLDP
ncbi:MAG: hypothetical protein ABI200_03520 [Gaiellales bacterium]